mmetsp:Transcript_22908/g.42817  ORF Transcript_22908/g.42817 Transcript_22908/m.42817 type:complete len:281 (+) Transcript_22908:504-1346(+)
MNLPDTLGSGASYLEGGHRSPFMGAAGSERRAAPMPFDDVYSDKYAGMDTLSHITPQNMGGSPAVPSLHSKMLGTPAGTKPSQAPRSALSGAGSVISTAGNGTRSQITYANFGGGGMNDEPSSARSTSRFAGKSTRSSISAANFGGDGVDDRFKPNQSLLRQSPRDHRRETASPRDAQRAAVHSSQAPYARDYSESAHVTPSVTAPRTHVHGNAPTNQQSPLNERTQEHGSGVDTPVVSPLVEKMVREIAELRVRNQELDSYASHLERKLSAYETRFGEL